jgi:flagellar hook-basal body complex protein FliE
MTDNDYIAEYVKERHSGLLGFDFAMWKFARKVMEAGQTIRDTFNNPDFLKALKEANEEVNKKQE